MKILVVVPTYNEAKNLPLLLEQVMALEISGLELLVVDDNSPDGTAKVVEDAGAAYKNRVHVLRRARKEGLGPAYVAGFKEALRLGADVVVQMDADLSHPPQSIPTMLEGIKVADVVVGSRHAPGGGVTGDWGLSRRLLSRWGDLYVRWVLGLRIRDTKSGFKAFRRAVLEDLPLETLHSKGFIFQAEVVYVCQKMGFDITEVPYIFLDRQEGQSKMSLRIILEALWRSYQIRWAWRGIQPANSPK